MCRVVEQLKLDHHWHLSRVRHLPAPKHLWLPEGLPPTPPPPPPPSPPSPPSPKCVTHVRVSSGSASGMGAPGLPPAGEGLPERTLFRPLRRCQTRDSAYNSQASDQARCRERPEYGLRSEPLVCMCSSGLPCLRGKVGESWLAVAMAVEPAMQPAVVGHVEEVGRQRRCAGPRSRCGRHSGRGVRAAASRRRPEVSAAVLASPGRSR